VSRDKIRNVWACLCGTETDVTSAELHFGSVFECPGCRVAYARVRPIGGGSAWVEVSPVDVEFHNLLGRRT
jgi:hypothetical protein